MKEIYLDSAATTKPDPQVLVDFVRYSEEFPYNPSSMLYEGGMNANTMLSVNRYRIARACGCEKDEVFFTSGGTEGNNMIIRGFFDSVSEGETGVLITSQVEHPSVLRIAEYLENRYTRDRMRVYYIPVIRTEDEDVVPHIYVDEKALENTIKAEIDEGVEPSNILVSIQGVNNELGCAFDTYDIYQIAKKYGCYVHSDKVQEVPHFGFEGLVKDCDAATVSAHKFGALRGTGFVVIKKDLQKHISPLLLGGGQEYGMRSGTENVAGICAMANQVERGIKFLNSDGCDELDYFRWLFNALENADIPYVDYDTSTSILSITLPGVEGSSLASLLSERGIYISVGSSCHSFSPEPSHVLKAIGLSDEDAQSTIRICWNIDITVDDWNEFIKWLIYYIKMLKGE